MTVKESGASPHEDDVELKYITVRNQIVCPRRLIVKGKWCLLRDLVKKNGVASSGYPNSSCARKVLCMNGLPS